MLTLSAKCHKDDSQKGNLLMSIKAKEFRSLLKETFSPFLADLGFNGTGGLYRRFGYPPYVHIIQFFVDKWGSASWMEMAVHIDGLPDTTQHLVAPDKVDAAACLIRRPVEKRQWMKWKRLELPLGESRENAIENIDVFTSAVARDMPRFFDSFVTFPGRLWEITPEEVLRESVTLRFLGEGRHMKTPLLLMLSGIHIQQGDPDGAKRFAESGLSLCGDVVGNHLKRLLDRLMEGNTVFGFTPEDDREFELEQESFITGLKKLK